jgi:hypothetical protein
MTKREKIGLIIICVLLLLLTGTIFYCICEHKKLNIANNNIEALTDTITQKDLKNGELLCYNQSLVLEKQELEKYLQISHQEVKDLERKLDSKLLYISKLEGSIKTDTIYIENTVSTTDSLSYRYSFMKDTKYYTICGYTDVDENHKSFTTITENTIPLKLKVGLTEDWKICVTTNNPHVQLTSIDGAVVDKDVFLKQQKKDRFSIGIQFGFGAQYGLMHRQFDYGPYIGIGAEYRIFSW